MPSALSHDPSISTPGASTDNAIVIFDGTGGTGFGNSTILVDSGGNGRIGIAADTDIITVTAETVTIAGKLVATSIDVGDGAVTVDVTQSNHSLTVGMPIKVSGANQYAAAQANSAANAEVVGIVTAVASSSAFTMTLAGEITTATAVPDSTSPGDIVYLSASSAGAVTTTEPSTAGQVSKPIGVVTEANNKMIMLPFRGEVVSSATDSMDLNGTELVLDVDADTSITADTDDQIDIKISGADDFRFTANSFNVLSGSTLTIDSGATITNSGTANGFGIASVVADTTPQLGGNLDMQARLLVGNGGTTGIAISSIGEVTMAAQPSVSLHHSAAQNISDSTTTAIAFNAENWKVGNSAQHSTSTNNSRLIAKVAGKYLVGGTASYSSNNNGTRYIEIAVNGTEKAFSSQAPVQGGLTRINLTYLADLAVDDYVELRAYQSGTGATLTINRTGNEPNFWMTKVA